ncbi:VlpC-type protein (plasmid) [Borrelia turicatae 91E135]|uniref:Variable large protein n=1 Tax=Borrelia turicatae (strain 91E135) TaxID=314724 RepID=A0ABF7R0B6_BORT9|nr:VlpC-type protein [Borrelia turicatae 91E135]
MSIVTFPKVFLNKGVSIFYFLFLFLCLSKPVNHLALLRKRRHVIMKRITLSALLMTLFLLLSCGSGSSKTEDPQNKFLKSLISLSNDFLNVFTSFSNMVGGVLGFDTNTKKSDVGNYFKKIQETVQGTKDKLEKIVSDMKSENNPNAEATDTAVKALITNTLDKIIQGLRLLVRLLVMLVNQLVMLLKVVLLVLVLKPKKLQLSLLVKGLELL